MEAAAGGQVSQVRAGRFIRIYRMAAPSSAGRRSVDKERNTMVQYVKTLLDLYLPEKAEGQGLVEYGLIIALVSVVAIAGLILLGDELNALFSYISGVLNQ